MLNHYLYHCTILGCMHLYYAETWCWLYHLDASYRVNKNFLYQKIEQNTKTLRRGYVYLFILITDLPIVGDISVLTSSCYS